MSGKERKKLAAAPSLVLRYTSRWINKILPPSKIVKPFLMPFSIPFLISPSQH